MPDYIFMLESRLSPEQLQMLNRVQQEAQDLSLNIYLVGGAVRDLMTGSPIRDLDFSVEGNPSRLVRRLEAEQGVRVEADAQRRRAEFRFANGVSLSLEMARNEFYEAPGKPPQVTPAPIFEDLRRRDFSVNAMGISLAPGSRGLLLDPTNGLADIESRELRVLHNYSFVHDPLRLFRLVRFTSRLGFRADPRTQELFSTAVDRGYQNAVTGKLLGREVEQITREQSSAAVLKALAGHGLLGVFHPVLQKRGPDYDGLARLQKYRNQAEQVGYRLDPFYLALYYLMHRLKGRAQKQFLRRLGLRKEQVKQALTLEREARKVVKSLGRHRKAKPRQVYQLLTPVAIELLVFILVEYSKKKKVQARVHNFLFKYRPLRGKLPVRELQLMGVPPGPKFDQILERYFEAMLDGKLRGRAQQLRSLRKLAGLPKTKPKPAAKTREAKEKKEEAPEGAAKAAIDAIAPAEAKAEEARPTVRVAAKKVTPKRPVSKKRPAARKKKAVRRAKKPRKKKRGPQKRRRR